MTKAASMGRGGARLAVWLGAAALVAAPLAVLKALDPKAWDTGDLPFAVALVVALGAAWEVAARLEGRLAYWGGLGLALATGAFQVLANLAVGVIGSEDQPANLLFFGVVAIAALGVLLARFRPAGLKRAMVAAAVAQTAAFAIAWAAGYGFAGPITVFFTGLWLTAAWLFHKARAAAG